MRETLLIRADGGTRIGTGHVMRCLALAQEWQRTGGKACFAHAETTPSLDARLDADGICREHLDARPGSASDHEETIALARKLQARWVVADGYAFGSDFQRAVSRAGFRLLILDDYGHAESYCADLILNQNLGVDEGDYAKREPRSRLLFGAPYVLLRKEFREWRSWRRQIAAVARRVIITLGGSDPENASSRVLKAVASLPNLEIAVVIGGSNPNRGSLDEIVKTSHSSEIELLVEPKNFVELLARADVSVSAAGSTAWEIAFMGLPNIVTILADNQRAVARSLAKAGVARLVGEASEMKDVELRELLSSLLADVTERRQMSRRGTELVDGLGAERVAATLRLVDLELRPVDRSDSETIWRLANDTPTRTASFCSDSIPWEDHETWFDQKIRDANCFFYVGSYGSIRPIGQVRFDVTDGEGTISVSLDPSARGRGLGVPLILSGVDRFFRDSGVSAVHAYVKMSNQRSLRAFEMANFCLTERVTLFGEEAAHFVTARKFQ